MHVINEEPARENIVTERLLQGVGHGAHRHLAEAGVPRPLSRESFSPKK